MNTKRHNLKTLEREMRQSAAFDGPHFWNTATAVARLYVPASRWAAFVAWLTAR